jgi:hypothetical protein
MATLRYAAGTTQRTHFTPITTQLAALHQGAGTIAVLARLNDVTTNTHLAELGDATNPTNFYHSLDSTGAGSLFDDDNIVGSTSTSTALAVAGATADDFQILVVDWPAGGAALERFHASGDIGAAESWTHSNSTGNNGGSNDGGGGNPGTGGDALIGRHVSDGDLLDVALAAFWVGVRFSDANVLDLWVNKKTSDWWNHPAGQPTMLVELTSTSPTDIGAFPSTFADNSGTLAGLDPTGWTFDGHGASSPILYWTRRKARRGRRFTTLAK